MKFFAQSTEVLYQIPAASLVGGAATFKRIQGPPGSRGQIKWVQTTVITGVTVAAVDVLVGTASDTDKFMTFEIPVSSANATQVSSDAQSGNTYVDADTTILIGTDGTATVGVADINVCIAWERVR